MCSGFKITVLLQLVKKKFNQITFRQVVKGLLRGCHDRSLSNHLLGLSDWGHNGSREARVRVNHFLSHRGDRGHLFWQVLVVRWHICGCNLVLSGWSDLNHLRRLVSSKRSTVSCNLFLGFEKLVDLSESFINFTDFCLL